jgi:probable phosphoglycerate mutase
VSLTVLGVRHGEVHNPDNVIYSGLPGYGLSELGRSQAADLGRAFQEAGVVALYASPLDRAIQTAEAIGRATDIEVVSDIRLHEWRHWAQWAGMTWDELRTRGREAWELYLSDPGSVTSGESLAELGDRMASWLADVHRDHDTGIVIGISHLEPLRAILLRSLGRPAGDLFAIEIGLGQVVRLAPDPDAAPVAATEFAVS